MYFKYTSTLLFVASLVSAAPTSASTKSASIPRQFNEFSISAGTGGTGLTQAIAIFPGNPGTLPSTTIEAYNVRHRAQVFDAKYDVSHFSHID